MIFLNPAVLFGLLAASIPVIIHLLNLKRLKKIEFSTLSFLKELQKNKIKRIKIKQWLLLALRVLIILFLVAAFARPTLKGVAIGGTTSAAKTTAVFILDDTFSMSVVDAKGSYLNQAKETIKDLMKNFQEGDEAALILVSDNQEENSTGGVLRTNLLEFEKSVDEVSVSYASDVLHNSILKAAEIISESKNFNKEIYIFSDFQKNRLTGETVSNLSEILNENIKIYAFKYGGKEVFNIGISDLKINTQIFEQNKPVSFDVSVTNFSERNADNMVVSLFINGERNAQQSVSLNPGEIKTISMEAIIKETGFIDVFVEIEDDDILYDNRRYSNLFIPEEIPVIIFSDNQIDSRFVKLALSASENERAINITERNLSQLSSFDLSKFEAVIIIGSDIKNTERLSAYVNNGGGLLIMPSGESSLQEFQLLLKNLNLPEPSGVVEKNNNDDPVNFGEIDFQHPLFQNIFANEKIDIESPDFYHFFKLQSAGKGRQIISFMDGSAFFSEYKTGKGKILLLSSAPVLKTGNFPLKSVFVPLMNKSVYYLSSSDQTELEYTAGNNIYLNLGNRSLPQIKVEKPDNTEEFINVNDIYSDYISYNKTETAGIYRFLSGENIIDYVSININPIESQTEYIDEKEFEDYLDAIQFQGNFFFINEEENPSEVVLQSRFGSELWKYFLLFSLILALIEMAVSRNVKKDLVET